jgi:uncharacterized protein (UPF0212 family)
MRALSTTEILSVWERGCGQSPVQRALTILAAANPESSIESLAGLSVGQRDARLVKLRELTFGPHFTGLANCPACDEKIELAFDAPAILPAEEMEAPAEIELHVEGRALRFRLPTSADLLEVNNGEELVSRCLLSGENHYSENTIRAIGEEMSAADPMADVRLALSCASCGNQWEAAFDIVAFFWREIASAARGVMREVHMLASAYGWSESEILALSQARRRSYLEMLNA